MHQIRGLYFVPTMLTASFLVDYASKISLRIFCTTTKCIHIYALCCEIVWLLKGATCFTVGLIKAQRFREKTNYSKYRASSIRIKYLDGSKSGQHENPLMFRVSKPSVPLSRKSKRHSGRLTNVIQVDYF